MNNLVIGSDGFLGKNLCSFLKKAGQKVVEIDIKKGINFDARFMKLPMDSVDRVYFLAWDVGGSKYLYNKNSQIFQMEWNSKLMDNVFPQIKNKPFVFVSSQLSEKTDTVYGVQKRTGEVWTKLSNFGVSIRLWNIYGYNEEFTERSHVISDFVYQSVKYKKIKMLTTGSELRQFIHIDDVCRGLLKSFDIQDKSKTYDLSSGEWVSLNNITKIIQKETGCVVEKGEKEGETVYVENKDFVPDWEPIIKLEDGLIKMIKELKNEC